MSWKIEGIGGLPGVRDNGLNTAMPVDFTEAPTVALPATTTVGGSPVVVIDTITGPVTFEDSVTFEDVTVFEAAATFELGATLEDDLVLDGDGLKITTTGTGADGLILENLKTLADGTLSGTALVVEISVGGTPYYFKVQPTLA